MDRPNVMAEFFGSVRSSSFSVAMAKTPTIIKVMLDAYQP